MCRLWHRRLNGCLWSSSVLKQLQGLHLDVRVASLGCVENRGTFLGHGARELVSSFVKTRVLVVERTIHAHELSSAASPCLIENRLPRTLEGFDVPIERFRNSFAVHACPRIARRVAARRERDRIGGLVVRSGNQVAADAGSRVLFSDQSTSADERRIPGLILIANDEPGCRANEVLVSTLDADNIDVRERDAEGGWRPEQGDRGPEKARKTDTHSKHHFSFKSSPDPGSQCRSGVLVSLSACVDRNDFFGPR